MNGKPQVAKLLIYPLKSLDGVAVDSAELLLSGALKGDRELALVDTAGQFVNGKRQHRIHALRTQWDLSAKTVSLAIAGGAQQQFHRDDQRQDMADWLSEYFGFPVQIQQNQDMGFPDDTASPGPTLVSTATLQAVASWFPPLTVDEVRRRFRSNIEISGVPAFWEDQLFSASEAPVRFQIGDVQLLGINPCQRCIVVMRHPDTGEPTPGFQKTFLTLRQQTFPQWAPRSRFDHFFRLAINTRIPHSEAGKLIRVGDSLTLN